MTATAITTVTSSDFDGLGHYRQSVTGGDFHPHGANARTERTALQSRCGVATRSAPATRPREPHLHDVAHASPVGAGYVHRKDPGGERRHRQAGVLLRRPYRVSQARENAGHWTTGGQNDLLVVFSGDQTNCSTKAHWGRATSSANPTTAVTSRLCTPPGYAPAGLPGGSQYSLRHTYASGSLATSKYAP